MNEKTVNRTTYLRDGAPLTLYAVRAVCAHTHRPELFHYATLLLFLSDVQFVALIVQPLILFLLLSSIHWDIDKGIPSGSHYCSL